MKILHSMMMRKKAVGVLNQMHMEYLASKRLNLNYEVKVFSSDFEVENKYKSIMQTLNIASKSKIYSWFHFRREYYKWLELQDCECYLLRYSVYDPYQYLFVKKIKKPVYFVHHTKESYELKLRGVRGVLLNLIDRFLGDLSLKLATGLIGVTHDIVDYEAKRVEEFQIRKIVYPNGILISKEKIEDERNSTIPELLFVASVFYPWHGLDLLLESLGKSNRKFVLHLVGELMEEDKLIADKDERIIQHGKMSQKEILNLSRKCWIGLGSFALERKKLTEASTLKVREYLSYGLPVYSGHHDVFGTEFYPYKVGHPEINDILEYAFEMREVSKYNIISESEKYISKEVILSNLIKELGNCEY